MNAEELKREICKEVDENATAPVIMVENILDKVIEFCSKRHTPISIKKAQLVELIRL